jgi:hypothetical protein
MCRSPVPGEGKPWLRRVGLEIPWSGVQCGNKVRVRFPGLKLEREQTLQAIVSIGIRFKLFAWSSDAAPNAVQ